MANCSRAHDFTSKVRLNHRCAVGHRAAALRLSGHHLENPGPGLPYESHRRHAFR